MKIPSLLVQNQERIEAMENVENELRKEADELSSYIESFLPDGVKFLISLNCDGLIQNAETAMAYKESIIKLPTHFLKQLSPNNITKKLSSHVDQLLLLEKMFNKL